MADSRILNVQLPGMSASAMDSLPSSHPTNREAAGEAVRDSDHQG